MRANDEMREEKRKNEENLLRELKVKVTEFENLKSIIQTKKSQIWHLDEEMRQINKDVIIMTAELQKLESSKESYKNSIKNRILIYHPKMQHLLGEIEKEFQRGSFTQKPIGPIGNEISLKGECKDLCFAAETALKSVISAFIVNNSSDAQKLDKMATYFGIRLKIIIDKFKDKIYDNINLHKCNLSASGEEISEYAYCIFDMITCSNPQIMNSLIDQLRIESVIIFRDTDKAQKIMSNMPPRNCFKAFTKYGDYIELSPYRFYSNRNKHNTARFLAPNIDHIISEIDNKYKENQKLLNGFKNRTIEVSDLKKKTTNELENLTQELGKFKMQILTIENKLEELKNTQILSSADVDIYKKEYEDQKVLYNEKCAEITVIESQINEKNAIIEKKLSEKLIIDSEISELQANDSQKNLQISKIMSKDKKYDAAIAIYSSKKTPLLPKYKEVEKNIEEINKIIIDYTSKAESVSPRIDTDRSIEDLESEISQTEEIIRIKEQEFGDENQILKTIYLKRTKLRCVEEEINNFKNFLLNLEDSILKRTENQLNLRNSMTTRACLAFDMILKNRGYKGDMIINHDNHTLDISVNIPSSNYENSLKHTNSRIQRALSSPNNISNSRQNQIQSDSFNNLPKMPKLKKTKQVNSQSDIAALSGGERSFATICFIVALWRTMNSPLRCLDEFDVFMDMVNRRYSMDLLLNLAQSEHNSNVQFIFLTPLDMSYLKPSKYISIYKISKEEDKEAH
ncbi:MAG: Structural maintenance of chromosomes protein 6 [Marteilia pararefringens]